MSEIVVESKESWKLAAEAIKRGDLVVFPTDTVYGVGCNPYNVSALDNIYIAKGRPQSKAVPLLLSDTAVLAIVAGALSKHAQNLGMKFWPGAITLVVERSRELPAQLGAGKTIAVRVPAHEGLRSLLAVCGGALAVTSANRSGEPDAVDAQSAEQYLGGQVALYIDGGRSPGSQPSTVVDCSGDTIRILREGPISEDDIRRVAEGREV